jgi:NadR type nicotinamide-nucleotide adenylyltransferase
LETKKIVVIGPECTGKSELSEYLATEFNTVWVREYAREYLDALDRPYEVTDLPLIAQGQLELEDSMEQHANDVLVCDTDLHVIKVWSVFKYGFCDLSILKAIAERKYDLYLLTYIDVPWAYDPLREHPDQRDVLFSIYLRELQSQPVPFTIIKGSREERRTTAKEAVSDLLGRNS